MYDCMAERCRSVAFMKGSSIPAAAACVMIFRKFIAWKFFWNFFLNNVKKSYVGFSYTAEHIVRKIWVLRTTSARRADRASVA